jgi:hypothetical protein
MREDDRKQSHEELWKSQEDESMPVSTDEVCARARRHARNNVRGYWVLLGVTAFFVAGFLYNLIEVRDPRLIAGTALVLAACCYIGWKLVGSGPARMMPAEPCVDFLRRGFLAQRRGLLWVRRGLLLLAPGIVVLWWGGGPVLGAKTLGIQSVRWLRILEGPMPLIVIALVLAFEWFAFSKEVRKVDREIEKLGHE